ncbi:V-type ATPase assembly factor PKR1 [Phlyctema vagabunda]|uniref:V-type ATPase assembly factor PKR1 n=1 Tax=Phlyctema vagabunda TaxID=108571 RepID=A0ABR4PNQ0_9HELO
MATFFTDLVQSIFTPGPTPTLVVATNVAFASLQLVLLLLLIATYSIHFLILSFLSAALWSAINWFVKELAIAQAHTEEEARKRGDEAGSDSETEAETIIETDDGPSGSKEVEVLEQQGELKARHESSGGSKSEISTEDEWERVSENEKDK